MEKVTNILNEIGAEDLIPKFQDESVDDDALIALTENQIATLIPSIGKQAKFMKCVSEYKKFLFQSSCSFGTDKSSDSLSRSSSQGSAVQSERDATVTLSQADKLFDSLKEDEQPSKLEISNDDTALSNSLLTMNLRNLLASSLDGKGVIKFYEKYKYFDASNRRTLVSIVMTHMLGQSEILANRDMEAASRKISELFPTENSLIYYVPTSPALKISRGKLVDKYRNQRRKFRSAGVTASQKRRRTEEGEDLNEGNSLDLVKLERHQDYIWLRHNAEPWSKVTECWRATEELRIKGVSYNEMKLVSQYFEMWPILRQPLGYTLIEMDFASMHPEKENSLLVSWNTIADKLHSYMVLTMKDCIEKQRLVEEFEQQKEDTKTLYIIQALPHVCKPTSMIRSSTSSKKSWKPSLFESLEGMLIHIPNAGQIQENLDRKQRKMEELHLTFQPTALAVGPSEDLQSFYVHVDGIMYKVNSLIKAIDLSFKTIFAMHANYAPESIQLWYFLQAGAYKISTPWDQPCPAALSLISSLGI